MVCFRRGGGGGGILKILVEERVPLDLVLLLVKAEFFVTTTPLEMKFPFLLLGNCWTLILVLMIMAKEVEGVHLLPEIIHVCKEKFGEGERRCV